MKISDAMDEVGTVGEDGAVEEDAVGEDVVIGEEEGEGPVNLLVKFLVPSEEAAHRSTRLRKILQI